MPITNAQRTLGTGGVNVQRMGGAMPPMAGGQPSLGSIASQAQKSYNQAYGGMPPQQALDARSRGQLPPPPPVMQQETIRSTPATPPAPAMPASPGLSPGLASAAEAAMPGFHTGNSQPGIPAAEAGIAPRPPSPPRSPGGRVSTYDPSAPVGPPPTGPAVQPYSQPAAPIAQAAQAAQAGPLPPPPAAPAPQAPVAPTALPQAATPVAPAAAPAQPEMAKSAAAPQAPAAPGSVTNEGFVGAGGNLRRWDDVNWQAARTNNIDPMDYIANAPNPLDGYLNQAGIHRPKTLKGQPASVADYTAANAPQTIDANYAAEGFSDPNSASYIADPYLQIVAMDMADKAEQLRNNLGTGSDASRRNVQQWQERLNAGQALLSRYGIQYNPRGTGVGSPTTPPVEGAPGPAVIDTPGGGEVVDPGGGSGLPPATTTPTGSAPPTTTPGTNPFDPYANGGGAGNADPGIGDARTDWNVGDTDIRTKIDFGPSGSLTKILRDMGLDVGNLSDAAKLEFATQLGLKENDLVNRQKGINVSQQAYENTLAANNPLRQKSETLANSILDNPDPVNWEAIKNREASDLSKSASQVEQQLSASAGRRGLNLGAVAGAQSQIGADSRNALARRMSELDTEEQRSRRNAEGQALAMAGDVNRNYSGAENVELQRLANMVSGHMDAPGNPYSGLTNTASNIQATQIAQDAARAAEDAARKQRYSDLFGQVLGAGARVASAGIMG